jgi:hypothetical protein
MMKRLTSAIAGVLLTLTAVAIAGTSGARSATADSTTADPTTADSTTADSTRGAGGAHGFQRFLQRYEAANTAFVNGDPTLWLALTAEKDPASIFGGFGGLGEAGTSTVHQRYLLAAGAFQPSGARVEFEYLVKDVRHGLAYTVAIERSNVLYTGRTQRQPQILRVTMIFRFERGAWRIVHRHADTMIDLELPGQPG